MHNMKEVLAWMDIKNKYNIEDYFSRDEAPFTHGTISERMASECWLDWIDFTLSQAQYKIHRLILCITKFWETQHSPTITRYLFKLISATMLQEAPHGKQMGDFFKKPGNQFKRCGKRSPHIWLSSPN